MELNGAEGAIHVVRREVEKQCNVTSDHGWPTCSTLDRKLSFAAASFVS